MLQNPDNLSLPHPTPIAKILRLSVISLSALAAIGGWVFTHLSTHRRLSPTVQRRLEKQRRKSLWKKPVI